MNKIKVVSHKNSNKLLVTIDQLNLLIRTAVAFEFQYFVIESDRSIVASFHRTIHLAHWSERAHIHPSRGDQQK